MLFVIHFAFISMGSIMSFSNLELQSYEDQIRRYNLDPNHRVHKAFNEYNISLYELTNYIEEQFDKESAESFCSREDNFYENSYTLSQYAIAFANSNPFNISFRENYKQILNIFLDHTIKIMQGCLNIIPSQFENLRRVINDQHAEGIVQYVEFLASEFERTGFLEIANVVNAYPEIYKDYFDDWFGLDLSIPAIKTLLIKFYLHRYKTWILFNAIHETLLGEINLDMRIY